MFSPRSLRGFSLIEITVSLFMLGVILVLSQSVLNIIPLGALAKHKDIALKIASHQLEELRSLGYENLPASGSFVNPDLMLLASSTGMHTISDYNDKTKEVSVTVSWIEPSESEPYEIELKTLITEIGGLP
jgi:prepilin-type N-terminal cleavage/methylation domain-containing protein